ncbi:MAG: tetratricopeptide repeat protein [Bacteroidota bacterium]
MRKALIITLLLISASLTGLCATVYNDLWQKGNKFYQQKEYDSAAAYLERVAASNPQDAEVYYNLGTTYYRLNKIGPAILNYQRALRIKPSYKEAKDNLLLTESRILNRVSSAPDIFFVRWWKSITNGTHANTWAIITLLIFLSILASVWMMRIKKSDDLLQTRANVVLGIVWVLFLIISIVSAGNKSQHNMAVVMQSDAPLMATMAGAGKPQIYLPEGTTIELKNETNEWAEVMLPDGRYGWIQKSWFVKI